MSMLIAVPSIIGSWNGNAEAPVLVEGNRRCRGAHVCTNMHRDKLDVTFSKSFS